MKRNIPYIIGLFIQPTLSAFYAVSRWWEKGAQFTIILFTTLVGLTAHPKNSGLDLYYYLTNFPYGYESENPMDFYVNFLQGIVIKFTTNSHVFLGVVGLILGFFVAKSLTRFPKTENRMMGFIIVFLFLCIFGLYMIGGIRFVTAFYVYFYGVISYLNTNDKKYLLLVCLSPLIHYTFIIAIFVFLFSLVISNHTNLLKYLVLVSFLFSFLPASISYELIFSRLLNVSGFYQGGIEFYVSEEGSISMMEHAATAKWYTRYSLDFIKYTLLIIFYLLYRKRHSLFLSKGTLKSLVLAASFFVIVNIFQYVPHFGIRFSKIFLAFAIYALFRLYVDNPKKKQFGLYIISIGIFSVPYIGTVFINILDIFSLEKAIKPLLLHLF